jgi:hypothetical protein
MFVGGSGGEGCLHPFSPRLPGLLPSPVPKDGEGEASSRARILPSARGGDPGLTRTCAPCSSGDAALEGAATGPGRPSVPPGGGVWRATGLGTTLGRACSRGCRERKVRSKIGWLAGSRDSHHVSRFAAFFILARAEISVDGSCFGVSFLAATLDAGLNRLRGKEKRREAEPLSLSPFLFASPSPIPLSPVSREGSKAREGGCAVGGSRGGPPPFLERKEGGSHASHRGRTKAFLLVRRKALGCFLSFVSMILPQVHLRKPCYDFSFL